MNYDLLMRHINELGVGEQELGNIDFSNNVVFCTKSVTVRNAGPKCECQLHEGLTFGVVRTNVANHKKEFVQKHGSIVEIGRAHV